jgi:Zn-dependent M16 (insulinase) family peptidase
MTIIHGFRLLHEESIAELKTDARLYQHVKTGAELLSLTNEDENKVFGITFRTPPRDSTGVAHILEHSVLCGSRKYPVKEPFVELLKGSLKTFLNAFTYPDKTCYPVASQNVQDFYNLIDVYLDAVFYPRISPFIFQQEGWHLELENPEAPLTYKGVVFSEMKGVYSSPDSILGEKSQQLLYPDITYGLDSGGDPKEIPKLTYEVFKEFHRRLYSPTNARIFFYGDDDPVHRLFLVNEYLKEFGPIKVDSSIPLQARFAEPVQRVHAFPSSSDGKGDEVESPKGMITVSWLLPEATDIEAKLGFQVLEYALLGMPGSPLRKALIDSGLGADIAGTGLEDELRQMYFSTGLKGIDIENSALVRDLILKTLARLVTEGIDPLTIEAALNTIEFRLRENNSGSFPRGIVLMLRALTAWLHGGDPIRQIAFEAPLKVLRESLAANQSYFENMIERYFLGNTHRVTLILRPDPELVAREEADERERLASIRRGKSASELEAILENTRELKRLQEAPDSPEALATIPSLKISDLERHNKTIPLMSRQIQDTRLLFHDLFTSGIAYLDLGFDLHALPQKHLPFVPLLGRAFLEMGTQREDFVSLTQRISRKTGGIRPELFTSSVRGGGKGAVWLFLRGKSMVDQTQEMFGILSDVLLTSAFDNKDRFRQMVLEEKSRQEQRLVPSGHQIVNMRIRSHFNEADWAAEQMGGVSYLSFLRNLVRRVDEDWPAVFATLEEMRRLLVRRGAMLANVTLDEANRAVFESQLVSFLDTLPAGASSRFEWLPEYPPTFEGMTIPSQINYVGKGADLYSLGYRFHGSAMVAAGYLRNTWLWERIRVQGGAYGAFCIFDRHSGAFTFVSYRDPNLTRTLDNFDASAKFLREVNINEDELAKAVVGTIGGIDGYLLPDAKGYASMARFLTGDTDEVRQRMRDEVMNTGIADFRAFADVLEEAKKKGIVKVLGSESAMAESLAERPDWLHLVNVL